MNLKQSPYGPTAAGLWALALREGIRESGSVALGCVLQQQCITFPASFPQDLPRACLVPHTYCEIFSLNFSLLPGSPSMAFLPKGTVSAFLSQGEPQFYYCV